MHCKASHHGGEKAAKAAKVAKLVEEMVVAAVAANEEAMAVHLEVVGRGMCDILRAV